MMNGLLFARDIGGHLAKAFAFILFFALASIGRAYDVKIQDGPSIDAGPNTYISPPSSKKGMSLMEWFGGKDNIQSIHIGKPKFNADQSSFSENIVRSRFENSTWIDASKTNWSYAPLTGGTVYLKDGQKANFTMFLSGIVVGRLLFAEQRIDPNPAKSR